MRLNDGGQRWWWWWCVRQMEIKTKVDWMFDGDICVRRTHMSCTGGRDEWMRAIATLIKRIRWCEIIGQEPTHLTARVSEREARNRNGCNVRQPLKISALVWVWWSRVGREAKIYWYWAISFRRDSYTYTGGICGKRNRNETYTHTLSLAVIIIIIYLIIPSGRCRVITIYLFPLRCFHRYSNCKAEGKEWMRERAR